MRRVVTVSRARTLAAALAVLLVSGCTETNLYASDIAPPEADRVALTGRTCTEDPAEARFPVRVVLLVDQAAGPLFSEYDPQGDRTKALSSFVQSALTEPEVEIAVVRYAGGSLKLAPIEGDFTRNPGELLAAITQLAVPEPCLTEAQCRDYHDGLHTAMTLIEGDMASHLPGVRVLTQYVVMVLGAGLHVPLAAGAACCLPDDLTCKDAGKDPSWECQANLDAELVSDMVGQVAEAGAAGMKVHAFHLAAELDDALNDQVAAAMQQMAFAAGGGYLRIGAIGALTPDKLDVLDVRTVLQAKNILISNRHALPSADGPVPDTDADGLSDAEEPLVGTGVTTPDTDGDGIGDLIEVLLGLDLDGVDEPAACQTLDPPEADTDHDGLSDCEELLIGTDRSLVDTDGDGLPDRLELVFGTNYLVRDAEGDPDADGVSNAEEIRNHTDPQSTDAATHLSSAYRYEIEDAGFVTESAAADLEHVTGVTITEVSAGTTAGLGVLFWDADAQTLAWQDAFDPTPGAPIDVSAGGTHELPSSTFAPIQGDDGRRVFVQVNPVGLPPVDTTETVPIKRISRHCLDWTVRNVRMMATGIREGELEPGHNDLLVYFGEVPEGELDVAGPFRLALVPFRFVPPSFREPEASMIEVADDAFVPSIESLPGLPAE